MGSSNPSPELTLNFEHPKTISRLLGQVSTTGNVNDKLLQIDEFVNQLEAETRKIQVFFKGELPLCMLLINDAIVALKEESMLLKKSSNVEPVLEEFIPLKNTCDDNDRKFETEIITEQKDGDKKNWLSSTQLWNTNENLNQKANSVVEAIKKSAEEQDDASEYFSLGIRNPVKGNDLDNEVNGNSRLIPCSTSNIQSNIRIGRTLPSPPQQQISRKQRRCWSTELHRRFVNALQQLGGSQAATPKQIRELMKVDGLTNDEVKSHLQKYRLHTRRHPSPNTNQSNVVLGAGLWTAVEEQKYIVTSKSNSSHSGSPDGPLPNRGNTMDDEEDEKSENYCFNGNL